MTLCDRNNLLPSYLSIHYARINICMKSCRNVVSENTSVLRRSSMQTNYSLPILFYKYPLWRVPFQYYIPAIGLERLPRNSCLLEDRFSNTINSAVPTFPNKDTHRILEPVSDSGRLRWTSEMIVYWKKGRKLTVRMVRFCWTKCLDIIIFFQPYKPLPACLNLISPY